MIKTLFTITTIIFVTNIFAQTTGEFSMTVNWSNAAGSQSVNVAIYVPSNYNANNNYALVVGFHGQGDDGTGHLNRTNSLKTWADNQTDFGDMIVACPSLGAYYTSTEVWDNNQGIIEAIRNTLANTYHIDYGKVFAQGFSYGGKTAVLFGLDEADMVAGIIADSPAWYGDEDLLGTCSSANCNALHYDINWANSSNIYLCSSSGGGAAYPNNAITQFSDMIQPGSPSEFYMTPLGTEDQVGATGDDSFFLLAFHTQELINNNAANHGVMYASQNQTHTMPTMDINKLCWDFVQQGVSTNISELTKLGNNFNIYPNPATSNVQLIISNEQLGETIQILDITGKTVKPVIASLVLSEVEGKAKQSLSIDISNLQNGVYFIKVGNTVQKFIKE